MTVSIVGDKLFEVTARLATMAVRCWDVSPRGLWDEKEDGKEENGDCIEGKGIRTRYKNEPGSCERVSCLTALWCQNGRTFYKVFEMKT